MEEQSILGHEWLQTTRPQMVQRFWGSGYFKSREDSKPKGKKKIIKKVKARLDDLKCC